jgi:hypothetical protein
VELMIEAKKRAEIDIFGFCLMSNHWSRRAGMVRPRRDRDLAGCFSWLINTHVTRYRAYYRRTSGHLCQGRYKSFAVEDVNVDYRPEESARRIRAGFRGRECGFSSRIRSARRICRLFCRAVDGGGETPFLLVLGLTPPRWAAARTKALLQMQARSGK